MTPVNLFSAGKSDIKSSPAELVPADCILMRFLAREGVFCSGRLLCLGAGAQISHFISIACRVREIVIAEARESHLDAIRAWATDDRVLPWFEDWNAHVRFTLEQEGVESAADIDAIKSRESVIRKRLGRYIDCDFANPQLLDHPESFDVVLGCFLAESAATEVLDPQKWRTVLTQLTDRIADGGHLLLLVDRSVSNPFAVLSADELNEALSGAGWLPEERVIESVSAASDSDGGEREFLLVHARRPRRNPPRYGSLPEQQWNDVETPCHQSLTIERTERFAPLGDSYRSLDMLDGLTRADVILNETEIETFHRQLWTNVAVEYDAEVLCTILGEMKARGMPFSDEFIAFEKAWRRDEYQHYLGFRRMYSILFGTSEEELHRRASSRVSDFSRLAEHMTDEFGLLVLIGYDEMVTTRSYARELHRYRQLGNPRFGKWMQQIARDEMNHFRNTVRVLHLNHADRLEEIPDRLEKLVRIDLSREPYSGTFVLDHESEDYSPEYVLECRNAILRHFEKERRRHHVRG